MSCCCPFFAAAGELLIWGWRLPFLFAILTLVAAALLRYNMPESTEVRGLYVNLGRLEAGQGKPLYLKHFAVLHWGKSGVLPAFHAAGCLTVSWQDMHEVPSNRCPDTIMPSNMMHETLHQNCQLQPARPPMTCNIVVQELWGLLISSTSVLLQFATSREEIDEDYHKRLKHHTMQAANNSNRFMPRTFSRSRSHSDSDAVVPSPKSPCKDAGNVPDVVIEDCAAVVDSSDMESQGSVAKHYVPMFELFRGYWSGLALQMGYEACEWPVRV